MHAQETEQRYGWGGRGISGVGHVSKLLSLSTANNRFYQKMKLVPTSPFGGFVDRVDLFKLPVTKVEMFIT